MGTGNFNTYSRVSSMKVRPWKIHPIWQGIGCLMLILIPVIAYAGAVLLVRENLTQHWLPMPREMAQAVTIPGVGMRVPYLYANLLTAAVLSLLGFGVVVVMYAMVYRMVGPSQLGPMDAPPVRRTPPRGKGGGRGYGGRR